MMPPLVAVYASVDHLNVNTPFVSVTSVTRPGGLVEIVTLSAGKIVYIVRGIDSPHGHTCTGMVTFVGDWGTLEIAVKSSAAAKPNDPAAARAEKKKAVRES